MRCLEQYLAWNRCALNCVRLVFPHIQIHATNSSKYTRTNPTIIFTSCFIYLEWFQSLSLFQNSPSTDSFLSRTKAYDTVLTSSHRPLAHGYPSRKRTFCFLILQLLLEVDFVWPPWAIFQRLLTQSTFVYQVWALNPVPWLPYPEGEISYVSSPRDNNNTGERE